MQKLEQLYAGKAKSVYLTDDPDKLILHFRNDTSAFDGLKVERLARKGEINNRFNAFIMEKIEQQSLSIKDQTNKIYHGLAEQLTILNSKGIEHKGVAVD